MRGVIKFSCCVHTSTSLTSDFGHKKARLLFYGNRAISILIAWRVAL